MQTNLLEDDENLNKYTFLFKSGDAKLLTGSNMSDACNRAKISYNDLNTIVFDIHPGDVRGDFEYDKKSRTWSKVESKSVGKDN